MNCPICDAAFEIYRQANSESVTGDEHIHCKNGHYDQLFTNGSSRLYVGHGNQRVTFDWNFGESYSNFLFRHRMIRRAINIYRKNNYPQEATCQTQL